MLNTLTGTDDLLHGCRISSQGLHSLTGTEDTSYKVTLYNSCGIWKILLLQVVVSLLFTSADNQTSCELLGRYYLIWIGCLGIKLGCYLRGQGAIVSTMYNVCSVLWGVLSTVEGVQYRGGYHDKCGESLEYRGDTILCNLSTVGDIMSTVGRGMFSTVGVLK